MASRILQTLPSSDHRLGTEVKMSRFLCSTGVVTSGNRIKSVEARKLGYLVGSADPKIKVVIDIYLNTIIHQSGIERESIGTPVALLY